MSKTYKQMTKQEIINATYEEITNAITLQAIEDGIQWSSKLDIKPVPVINAPEHKAAQKLFIPVVNYDAYEKFKINIAFDTADKAIEYARKALELGGVHVREKGYRTNTFIKQSVGSITAELVFVFNSDIESIDIEHELYIDARSVIQESNLEIEDKYKKMKDAFDKHVEQYFNDYSTIVRENNNFLLLVQDYKEILMMCNGNKEIARRFMDKNHKVTSEFYDNIDNETKE